jgi:hypothetical protein
LEASTGFGSGDESKFLLIILGFVKEFQTSAIASTDQLDRGPTILHIVDVLSAAIKNSFEFAWFSRRFQDQSIERFELF